MSVGAAGLAQKDPDRLQKAKFLSLLPSHTISAVLYFFISNIPSLSPVQCVSDCTIVRLLHHHVFCHIVYRNLESVLGAQYGVLVTLCYFLVSFIPHYISVSLQHPHRYAPKVCSQSATVDSSETLI